MASDLQKLGFYTSVVVVVCFVFLVKRFEILILHYLIFNFGVSLFLLSFKETMKAYL